MEKGIDFSTAWAGFFKEYPLQQLLTKLRLHLGALDSKSSRMLLDSMERLNIEYNATIMMVTHDAFTASYAHRILFIKDGKIFNEIVRGESSRKDFFNQIMEVVTLLGGDTSNVL